MHPSAGYVDETPRRRKLALVDTGAEELRKGTERWKAEQ